MKRGNSTYSEVISISLPGEVGRSLREHVQSVERPLSWVVTDAIRQYLQQQARTEVTRKEKT